MLWFVLIYLAAVNIAAYFLMKQDKLAAKQKQWRTAESVFFSLCFIGGFVGVYLAMQQFRHKTRHWQFNLVVILSAVIFLVILPILFLWRMNS